MSKFYRSLSVCVLSAAAWLAGKIPSVWYLVEGGAELGVAVMQHVMAFGGGRGLTSTALRASE
jgi:hypothetical protein